MGEHSGRISLYLSVLGHQCFSNRSHFTPFIAVESRTVLHISLMSSTTLIFLLGRHWQFFILPDDTRTFCFKTLEVTHKNHRVQFLASTRPPKNQTICLRALSKCFLVLGNFPGSLLQCPIALSVNNLFLISSLNLPCLSFMPFPQILSLFTREKRSVPAPPLPLRGNCRPL